MRKITVSWLVAFLLSSFMYGQEVSLAIPITPDQLSDGGFQIEKLTDGYLILGQSGCFDTNIFIKCLGLVRTDRNGNIVWNTNFDGSPYGSLRPNGRTMFLHNDTIHVANMIWKNDHDEIRMMSFDMDGNLINEADFFVPYESTFFLRGMIGTEKKLIVFSEAKQNGQHRVLIQDFDFQLNLLGEYHVGESTKKKRDVILKKAEKDSGYLLAYGEDHSYPGQSIMHFNKLDTQYKVTYFKTLPDIGRFLSNTDFIETEDDQYMLAWNIDYSQVLFDTFPYPTIVYGLDSLFEIEWEHIFVHQSAKEHISTIKTEEGNMLGMGATDYLRILSIYPERGADGWCFMLTPDGELLWERIIADIRDSEDCLLWHGIETEDGFVMTGAIDKDNPTGIPFLNDPEVWLLTLDKNGCWNGNCEDVIIITGDSTSMTITNTQETVKGSQPMKIFPNPTSGLLTIESTDVAMRNRRTVQISDINGQLISVFELHAPMSTINLNDLKNGLYIVTLMEEGMPVSSQTVIISQ